MTAQVLLGDVRLYVTFKDIKNIHLSVHPPAGDVTVSAPSWMNLDAVRIFAITKLAWIKRQRRAISAQARESVREFIACESHYVWGQRYLLDVVENDGKPSVELGHHRLTLRVSKNSDARKRRDLIASWYREQVKSAAALAIAEWAPRLDVSVDKFFVQHMKTKWGSCNHESGSIRLNTELAKKPKECFEYVVVHELVHMLEPTHNARFAALMDKAMPNWRYRRDLLNELPLGHVGHES